jgi:hypothetical protein
LDGPRKERDASMLRKYLHEAADELADMYERGEPLWLHKWCGIASTLHGDLKIDIFVKDWIV